jgi:hypothetical protein
MPPTGSTFTDWQQVDAGERRLLMDEDFSWSEPPAQSRRRRLEEPAASRRRTAVVDREPAHQREQAEQPERVTHRNPREQAARQQVAQTESEFDALMQRWNDAYGDGARVTEAHDPDAFDYADLARYTEAPVVEAPVVAASAVDRTYGDYGDDSGRRTVVITGRGAEPYSPASRRRQASELRFHERSGFSPDRTAMWAVLLGLALLLGCIIH